MKYARFPDSKMIAIAVVKKMFCQVLFIGLSDCSSKVNNPATIQLQRPSQIQQNNEFVFM